MPEPDEIEDEALFTRGRATGGWSRKRVLVEDLPERFCSVCERDRPFKLYLGYTVRNVQHFFRWVTDKSYFIECLFCRTGTVVTDAEAGPFVTGNPVRWFDRFGWVVGIGVIAMVLVLGHWLVNGRLGFLFWSF